MKEKRTGGGGRSQPLQKSITPAKMETAEQREREQRDEETGIPKEGGRWGKQTKLRRDSLCKRVRIR